jgi:hypothetical protein
MDGYGQRFGAGEGNRTLVVSLEGFCSTIELHPRCGSCPMRKMEIGQEGEIPYPNIFAAMIQAVDSSAISVPTIVRREARSIIANC